MSSECLKVIALFILTFVWMCSLGFFSYWVVYKHIRTRRAWQILNYIQAFAAIIGCLFATMMYNSIFEITSIPAYERSDDGVGLFLASIALPMIAVFLTMRFCFTKVLTKYWEIRSSFSGK
ncbi:MAG TPA: hypothetical protein VK742_12120 [Candidatus Sulfotelmatobacter sp.]|jgi:hypothetical protein|nr:hypothetical protein [Candidatus Sulfotelmatobacter sp.]